MGITTQKPELRKKLVRGKGVDEAVKWISNFINAVTKEVAQITGALGYNSIKDLNREDLRAITLEAAAMASVKLAGLEDCIPEHWKCSKLLLFIYSYLFILGAIFPLDDLEEEGIIYRSLAYRGP